MLTALAESLGNLATGGLVVGAATMVGVIVRHEHREAMKRVRRGARPQRVRGRL